MSPLSLILGFSLAPLIACDFGKASSDDGDDDWETSADWDRSSPPVEDSNTPGGPESDGGTTGDDTDLETGAPDEEDIPDPSMAILTDVWLQVVEPSLAQVQLQVAELKTALEDLQSDSASISARSRAQEAWVEVMRAWQVMEAMQIGPAASSLTAIGGENIRDEVYSWPTTNPCRVDQVTVRLEFEGTDFFDRALPNAMGLDAVETALFSPPNENSCSESSGINREGTWADMGAAGVAQARADLAVTLVTEIQADLSRLRTAWETGFAAQLSTAGAGSDRFDTTARGINAVYDGLFYLETFVKDRKLGWPLGLRDCGSDDCSDEVESLMAGRSNEWLAANLEGFRMLYTGGGGSGMYDLLVAVGEDGLANHVLSKLDAADTAVATLTSGLNETAASDPEALGHVHTSIKEVTDLLKVDIATVLSLSVPAESAGDND